MQKKEYTFSVFMDIQEAFYFTTFTGIQEALDGCITNTIFWHMWPVVSTGAIGAHICKKVIPRALKPLHFLGSVGETLSMLFLGISNLLMYRFLIYKYWDLNLYQSALTSIHVWVMKEKFVLLHISLNGEWGFMLGRTPQKIRIYLKKCFE